MTGLPHAGQQGDGHVSRACLRGFHRRCQHGCECSCHDGLGVADAYRILVTGSREFTDYEAIRKELGNLVANLVGNGVANCDSYRVVVVHGAARGADDLADRAARAFGMTTEPHPADWSRGKGAGYARNAEMVKLGADVCVAFYQPGAGNRGTDHCARAAEAAGIPVRRITARRAEPSGG